MTRPSASDVAAVAAELWLAERELRTIRQLSLRHPDMTIEDAYSIQRALVALKVADGRTIKGRKVGLTSQVMQRAVSIDEPDFGALLDDMFFADGSSVPLGRFIRPRIEVELAFVLGRALQGPGVTLAEVLAATDHVVPAMEILDSRVEMADPKTGHRRTIVDTISDNAANAGVVLGPQRLGPAELDLRWVPALLKRNGVIEESGVSAAVLDHPGHAVAWLANRLAGYGISLSPGEVVLSGSFTAAVHAEPGDQFVADFGPLGTVSISFDKAER